MSRASHWWRHWWWFPRSHGNGKALQRFSKNFPYDYLLFAPLGLAVDESWHLAIMPDSAKNSQPPIRTEIIVFTLTVSLFYPTQKGDYLSEINLLENLVTIFKLKWNSHWTNLNLIGDCWNPVLCNWILHSLHSECVLPHPPTSPHESLIEAIPSFKSHHYSGVPNPARRIRFSTCCACHHFSWDYLSPSTQTKATEHIFLS